MKGSMTIITPPQGETPTSLVEITLDKPPSLEVLQEIVGGWIERVPHWERYNGQKCIAYCNEEGKILKLQYNAQATALWDVALGGGITDWLSGIVVIVSGDADFMKQDEDEE
jgi:hypothetical protein